MYILTTILEFDDGVREGQIFHKGTVEECKDLANLIPAISYSGKKKIIKSCFKIMDDMGLDVGTLWKIEDNKFYSSKQEANNASLCEKNKE